MFILIARVLEKCAIVVKPSISVEDRSVAGHDFSSNILVVTIL